jgi:hypothetical protein
MLSDVIGLQRGDPPGVGTARAGLTRSGPWRQDRRPVLVLCAQKWHVHRGGPHDHGFLPSVRYDELADGVSLAVSCLEANGGHCWCRKWIVLRIRNCPKPTSGHPVVTRLHDLFV